MLEDDEKTKAVWEVSRDVMKYTQYKSVVDLGLTVNYSDLPFQDVMVFSWIKAEIESGAKA